MKNPDPIVLASLFGRNTEVMVAITGLADAIKIRTGELLIVDLSQEGDDYARLTVTLSRETEGVESQ